MGRELFPILCGAGGRVKGGNAQSPPAARVEAEGKPFYIETFGCQMNVHDSEKVAGVLMARGYRPVSTPEDADIILQYM